MKPRGADVVARTLAAAGVGQLFAVSGNHVMTIFDAALDASLRILHVRHEAAAVHMADAWARLTGDVSVALVTGGPGHANAVSALYTALEAESPVLLRQARYFLENLSPSRGPEAERKTLPRADIERRLAEIMVSRGEGQLNRLRDEARAIAPELGLEKEAAQLDAIIGALLGTRPDTAVSDKSNLARAQAKPFDINRVRLLEKLALDLREVQTPDFRPLPDIRGNVEVLHTFAFMEAYFSNFIEGTEFDVDEAQKVVFQGLRIPRRQDDTHDILNTYRLVVDTYEMSRLPGSAEEFLELLKARHIAILEHRRDKNPGVWKDVPNRAGNTRFVEPDLVEGTLLQGFPLYRALPHALARAVFMQIAVSEVHPFNDGNGRLSRVMMNAELTSANECRIIIPTVYRDDYITALKAFSQNGETDPVIRMFERAQAFTASMEYSNYEAAKESLTGAQAFKDPREGKLTFAERRAQ